MIQDWTNIFVSNLPAAQRKLGIVPSAGLPAGGLTGQVLTKASNANYDAIWAAGGGGGGLTNLDGGTASSVYGGTTGVDGGNA